MRTFRTALGFIFIGSLATLPTIVTATPSISSVESVATNPSSLIIKGSGFTHKKRAAPLVWQDFETGTANVSSTQDATLKGVIDSRNTPTGSGNALVCDASNHGACGISKLNFKSGQLYIYLNRYYSFSIDDTSIWGSAGLNLKSLRMWAGFDSTTNNNLYIGYQGKEGVASGRIFAEQTSERALWPGNAVAQVSKKWLQEEYIYKTSDINSENGILEHFRNGVKVFSGNYKNRTSERPSPYQYLYFDQISNGTGAKNLNIYYDNIYIDDTHHRVFLSDSPELSSAHNRKIAVPTEWTDTTIKVQLPSDGNSSEMYLYVADANGNINSKGYSVCSRCPAAPLLKVVQN